MTGIPSEPGDLNFAEDDDFVVEGNDATADHPPEQTLDEVFEEVDRELERRREMWQRTETAKDPDLRTGEDADELFVLAEDGLGAEIAAPAEVSAEPEAEPTEAEVEAVFAAGLGSRRRPADTSTGETSTIGEGFSADASIFDPPADENAEEAGESVLEAMDASNADLEIIPEEDPFEALAAAEAPPAAEAEIEFEAPKAAESWKPDWEDATSATEQAAAAFAEAFDDEVDAEETAGAAPMASEAAEEPQLYDEAAIEDPIVEDDEDPIYGTNPEEELAAQEAAAYEEPDYSEYEEAYAEAEPALEVVGAPVGAPRRRMFAMFAAAALVLVAAGGTVAYLRPDLIGLADPAPLVDRIEIARPQVEIEVPQPVVPVVDPAPVPDPTTDPVVTTPDVPPPVTPVIDPPTPAPVVPTPVPTPTPPVAVEPRPTPVPPALPTDEPSKVGEDLIVQAAEAPVRGRVHALAEGIASGSQAFAQLKNLNFFVGRVKAMDASEITLTLEPGEVTLAFDELSAIVPLASEEYRVMQTGEQAFVRLRNNNRLFGKILAKGGIADNVVLEVQKSLVTIPRHAIEEIGSENSLGVQVLQDDGEDWVRKLLRSGKGGTPAPQPPKPGR